MKFQVITFFLFFSVQSISAQIQYPAGMINMNAKAGGIIQEIKVKPTNYDKECYLLDDWVRGDVVFNSGYEFKNQEIKYDLFRNQLELKTEEGVIKIAPWENIIAFKIKDENDSNRYFHSSKSFENKDKIARGFYEVLNEGDSINLLKFWEVEILKPNYNPSLDIGSKIAEINKKSSLYISKNLEVYELPNSKKNRYNFIEESLNVGKERMTKIKKINCKSEEGVITILKMLDSK